MPLVAAERSEISAPTFRPLTCRVMLSFFYDTWKIPRKSQVQRIVQSSKSNTSNDLCQHKSHRKLSWPNIVDCSWLICGRPKLWWSPQSIDLKSSVFIKWKMHKTLEWLAILSHLIIIVPYTLWYLCPQTSGFSFESDFKLRGFHLMMVFVSSPNEEMKINMFNETWQAK